MNIDAGVIECQDSRPDPAILMTSTSGFENKVSAPLGWLIGGGAFLVIFLSLIVSVLLKTALPVKEYGDIYVLITQLGLGLCLFLFVRELGIGAFSVVRVWWKDRSEHLRLVLRYCLYCFGLMAVAVAVVMVAIILVDRIGMINAHASLGALEAATPNTAEGLKMLLSKSPLRFVLSLVAMCLVAPIVEEVFFRRLLYVSLRKVVNFIPALLVSSFLFSLLHPSVIQGVLGGLFLGYIYEKGKSLPANIMVHSVVNSSVIVVMLLL